MPPSFGLNLCASNAQRHSPFRRTLRTVLTSKLPNLLSWSTFCGGLAIISAPQGDCFGQETPPRIRMM
jgi:hypothetical protein